MLIDEGLELLTEDQCRELLAANEVGRVGITVAGLPVILPVNYACIDGDVVFRTGLGTKLHAASSGAVIAFEVDAYDVAERRGWSVLLIGRSSTIAVDGDGGAQIDGCALASWAGGDRSCYVRMHPEMITGRRIVST
jgi:uncharacterized protein